MDPSWSCGNLNHRTMKKILGILLTGLLLTNGDTAVVGQTNLPACSTSLPPSSWDNCQGVYTSNNEKYSGQFKSGQLNGQGTATFADGTKYFGEFKDGRPNGYGTATFVDRSKYVGEFK